jgi:glycosyltransferase involved in cell wall biosynthesis
MYDYIIVTHIPVFYKVNLYNELSKHLNIHVIFIADNTGEKRSNDFITLDQVSFEYNVLNKGDFQVRRQLQSVLKLRKIINKLKYMKILVSGWDLPEFWFLMMTNNKCKNCLVLESTIIESNATGVKGFIKRMFLWRTSTVYASGRLHVELLNKLKYRGKTKTTQGVGIINKPAFQPKDKNYQKRYAFIGRLSEEKNLALLVLVFNDLPDYMLTIVGVGPLENELKTMAKTNIRFLGSMENNKLKDIYLNHDILILPSLSEGWGLVIEEALFFRVPVIVSKNCGASELIIDGENGYVVDMCRVEEIKNTILAIRKDDYEILVQGACKHSIDEKDERQINVYTG